MVKKFKEFLRSSHLGWCLSDVEHHHQTNEEWPESHNFKWQSAASLKGGTYDKQYAGLNIPKLDDYHPVSKLRRPDKPYFSKERGQGHLDLAGGSGMHPTFPMPTSQDHIHSLQSEHDDIKKHFEHHLDNMPYEHKNMIMQYKGDSEDWNKRLRDTNGKEISRYHNPNNMSDPHYDHHRKETELKIHRMDNITNRPSPVAMHVFRGIHDKAFQQMPIGHEFTDHAFTGTSLLHSKAAGAFSHDGRSAFHIHVPEGTKGFYLDAHPNGLDHEREFLLHRGTRFQITGHSQFTTPKGSWEDHDPVNHITHLKIVSQADHKGRED